MKSLRSLLFLAIAVLFAQCFGTKSSANQNDLEGWHFHICNNETRASRVWFELSGTTSKGTYESREIKWHQGNSTFIAVPENMRDMRDMNLSVRTAGKNKVKFCVLYGQYVIKSIEASGTETNQLSQDGRDNCPC